MGKHLLIALSGEDQNGEIVDCLNQNGADIEKYSEAYTKQNIIEILQGDPTVDVVLVNEYLSLNSPVSAMDISSIDEINPDVQIIPVLTDKRKGTDYMQMLFGEAIYNAIFESDAALSNVANLIKNPRGKKDARLYYDIQKGMDLNAYMSTINPDDVISPSLNHVLESENREELENRLEYVRIRLEPRYFSLLLTKLPADMKHWVLRNPKYMAYMPREEVEREKELVAKQEEEHKKACTPGKNVDTKSFLNKFKKKKKSIDHRKNDYPEQTVSEAVRDLHPEDIGKSLDVAPNGGVSPRSTEETTDGRSDQSESAPISQEKVDKNKKQDKVMEKTKKEEDGPDMTFEFSPSSGEDMPKEQKPSKVVPMSNSQKRPVEPESSNPSKSVPKFNNKANKAIEDSRAEYEQPNGKTIRTGDAGATVGQSRAGAGKKSLLSISSGVDSHKRLVAVVGITEGAGSTFVAMNLARMCAKSNRETTFVQLPYTRDSVYKDNGYQQLFGYDFVQHMRFVHDGKPCPRTSHNNIDGVDFILDTKDDDSLRLWNSNQSLRLIMGIGGTVILDLGTFFTHENKFTQLEECTDIICVIDRRCDMDTNLLRKVKFYSSVSPNTKISFIINHSEEDTIDYEFEELIGPGYDKLYLPEYTEEVLGMQKNGFLFPYYMDDALVGVGSLCGVDISAKKTQRIRRTRVVVKTDAVDQGAYIPQGTIEVAFAGVTSGCGVTHTAIMCAASLANDYKVAYFENNGSGDLKSLKAKFSGERNALDLNTAFRMCGIDFYYNMPYEEFTTNHKPQYDFVIVDYGKYDETNCNNMIFATKRVIVADNAPWKERALSSFYEKMAKGCDGSGAINYLVPGADDEDIEDVSNICMNNSVRAVPYCKDPFHLEMSESYIFRSMLGIGVKKSSKGFLSIINRIKAR